KPAAQDTEDEVDYMNIIAEIQAQTEQQFDIVDVGSAGSGGITRQGEPHAIVSSSISVSSSSSSSSGHVLSVPTSDGLSLLQENQAVVNMLLLDTRNAVDQTDCDS